LCSGINLLETIKNNEELQKLYLLPDIIRMVKSRRMRWAGHIGQIKGEEKCVRIIGGKLMTKKKVGG
jgi:hypothetical protein